MSPPTSSCCTESGFCCGLGAHRPAFWSPPSLCLIQSAAAQRPWAGAGQPGLGEEGAQDPPLQNGELCVTGVWTLCSEEGASPGRDGEWGGLHGGGLPGG